MSMGGGEPDSQNDDLIPMAVASSSVPPPTPQWIDLPTDVTANILQRLGALEILDSAENVCTTWRRICADLSIQNSYGENLLNYIADRSIGLKRLTLNDGEVSSKCLNEAVKKLAHLEELHLVIMPSLQAEDIINIGISCSNLKSFTFNAKGFSYPSSFYTGFAGPINNKYALAIAGNMSNLCLIGNPIGNEGLEAILDGCLNLESLDLRQCYGLNLHGALSKRCSEQIKLLKLPLDPVSFVEYRGAPNYSDDEVNVDYDDDDDYDYDYDYDDFYAYDDDVIVFDSD